MPDGKYDLAKQRWLRIFLAEGRDGRIYLTLGDGLSLAAVPFALLEKAISSLTGGTQDLMKARVEDSQLDLSTLRKHPVALFPASINPAVMALLVLIFYNFALSLTDNPRSAFLASFFLGTGTILWPYSSTFWTQPIVTLCLFGAFYLLFLYGRNPRPSLLLAAGVLLGYSFITRYASVITLPWFVLYVALIHLKEKRRIPGAIGLMAASFGILFLLQMSWNWYRFGSVLNFGAKHQAFPGFSFRGKAHISLPAMLFGFNRGIFVFSPPLVLFFFSIRELFRKHRNEAVLVLGVAATYFAFYSMFSFWTAFASWGPRFLIPITPLLAVPICLFVSRGRWQARAACALLMFGIAFQLPAVLLPPQTEVFREYFGGIPSTLDYFAKSEIVPQARTLLAGNVELWFLDTPIRLALGLLLMAISMASAYYAYRVFRIGSGSIRASAESST